MAKRLFLTLCVLMFLLTIAVSSVYAGSVTVNGTLDGSDPSMPVVFISTPNCTGQGVTPVHYDVVTFHVDAAGTYNFTLSSPGGFASIYLYITSFNPATGTVNCIAADNTGNPRTLSVSLDPANIYFAVPFDDTFAQTGGSYQLIIDGPGNPILGLPSTLTAADICSVAIPEGSVVGDAPFRTQVYYAPGHVSPGLFLNPGTYHVIGQDETETYYKLFFNCQYIWVLKNMMQPSYLPPQNGAPLPQRIVN